MRKKEIRIPIYIGLIVAIGGLIAGLLLVQRQIRQATLAAEESAPVGVKISNITDSEFTVSWLTTKEISGHIQYGERNSQADIVVSDDRDQQKGSINQYLTHLVTVKNLKPETTYQFKIGSGKQLFDVNGSDYTVTTGSVINSQPAADVAYGQVTTSTGDPSGGSLLYLQIPNGVLQATLVKPSGSWALPLSTIRTTDLNSYVSYDRAQTNIQIEVYDGVNKSMVTTVTGNDSPTDEIVMGRNQNRISVPIGTSQDSKLEGLAIPSVDEINLLTPDPDEKINSFKPEFIGKAPAGVQITIEINSPDPITTTVVSDSFGNFSYTVPNNLSPGQHTITLSAVINGVVQTITRSFTVYAQDESGLPVYSATPSATLTPSTKPSPTIKPTATPRPTATPQPTATPTIQTTPIPTSSAELSPTPAATGSAIAKSGSSHLTLILIFAGIIAMGSGWWWYRKAV